MNTPVGGDASVEFNGMRQNHNIYLLDGGEDDDRGGAGGMSIAPSTDAIAEFRQLTSNYSADYGLSSAGTMTMVLKSGSSTLHASAWEFNRNDAFDARNFFNAAPQKAAELRLNVFGFNVGGPVTLGKLYNRDRKKTFFFYNMEWRRLIQGSVNNPDGAGSGHVRRQFWQPRRRSTFRQRHGGADGAVRRTARAALLLQVLCRGNPFPGNTIPTCMIARMLRSLLTAGIFPAPHGREQSSLSAATTLRRT